MPFKTYLGSMKIVLSLCSVLREEKIGLRPPPLGRSRSTGGAAAVVLCCWAAVGAAGIPLATAELFQLNGDGVLCGRATDCAIKAARVMARTRLFARHPTIATIRGRVIPRPGPGDSQRPQRHLQRIAGSGPHVHHVEELVFGRGVTTLRRDGASFLGRSLTGCGSLAGCLRPVAKKTRPVAHRLLVPRRVPPTGCQKRASSAHHRVTKLRRGCTIRWSHTFLFRERKSGLTARRFLSRASCP